MKGMTSAIEHLEREGAAYAVHEYPAEGGPVASKDVAAHFGFSADRVFKTLVMCDSDGGYYVFCLPARCRIDTKKASALVGVSNVKMLDPEMFHELTGYVHGGCSPFGQRTTLPLYVDVSAQAWDTIYFNGGRIGLLIEVDPGILEPLLGAQFAEFTK